MWVRLRLADNSIAQIPLDSHTISEVPSDGFYLGPVVGSSGRNPPNLQIRAVFCRGQWHEPSWQALDAAAIESRAPGVAQLASTATGALKRLWETQIPGPATPPAL